MKAAFDLARRFRDSPIGLALLGAVASMLAAFAFAYEHWRAAGATVGGGPDHTLSLVLLPVALLGVLAYERRLDRRAARLGRFYDDLVKTTEVIAWRAEAHDFRFSFVSDRAEHLLGYPAAEWRQPGFWATHLHPDDREWVGEYCALQNAQLGPYQFEFRFVAQDGRAVWLQNVVTVIEKDGAPWRLQGLMIDVSERKAGEERIQCLLAEKAAILQNAIVGIAFVRDRHIVSCNRRCEELFRYGPGELDGLPTAALYATPELYLSVGQRACATVADGDTFNDEVELKYKDGTPFWGALTGRALDAARPQDASIWIFADISHRRKAMEESRRLWRAVEQSPVSILITDRNGTIEYVNPKFAAVTGFSLDEAVGATPRILRSGETPAETYRTLWATILAGNVWRGELRNRRRNGDLFWEDATIAPVLDDNGAITHFIAIKEDITDHKRDQDELARHQLHLEELVVARTHALAAALDDARSADRAKDAFLANVSHEMRTPLNAVIGLSNLALAAATDARQRDYLEKISGAGATLLSVVDDLLDLSKIAAGRMDLDLAPFAPRRLIDRLIAIVGYRATEKGLDLRLHVAADLPEALVGDAMRLHQILLNLLGNAIKFTASGHVALNVEVLNVDAETAHLRFVVRDTGIGIAPAVQPTLFAPFTQADASITRRFGGTGLGLAICRRLIDMMGGELTFASVPGEGSTFSFSLRLAVGPVSATAAPAATRTAPPRFAGARALLADDQAINRQIVAELLAPLGIAVDHAEDGKRALDMLEAAPPGGYDLVFMDVQMPDVDGLSATRRLRAQPRFAQLPIVAMTARTLAHERSESLAAGMNDHLGKPFDPQRLYEILERWMPAAKRLAATPAAAAAAPTDASAAWPEMPGFDIAGALRRCGGQEDNYRRWLRAFFDEEATTADDIDRLLDDGKVDTALRRLHALKGRSGMLGIAGLHAAIAALEAALKTDAAPDDLRAGFRAAFDAARAAIAGMAPANVRSDFSQETRK